MVIAFRKAIYVFLNIIKKRGELYTFFNFLIDITNKITTDEGYSYFGGVFKIK